ncbi:hypothetical protein JHK87_024091 [Glycine soja]|nr:hypothetical protein JHK87_024091 [Glycine soja]
MINANFDASIKIGKGMGFGLVFRNHKGEVLASATRLEDQCYSPQIAEYLAFKWSIQMANQLLLQNVFFETDCREIANAILQDCRDITTHIDTVALVHTKKIGNIVADSLA